MRKRSRPAPDEADRRHAAAPGAPAQTNLEQKLLTGERPAEAGHSRGKRKPER